MKPCTHHMVLSSPHGPTIVGVCVKCGYTRVYRSSFEGDKKSLVTKTGLKEVAK